MHAPTAFFTTPWSPSSKESVTAPGGLNLHQMKILPHYTCTALVCWYPVISSYALWSDWSWQCSDSPSWRHNACLYCVKVKVCKSCQSSPSMNYDTLYILGSDDSCFCKQWGLYHLNSGLALHVTKHWWSACVYSLIAIPLLVWVKGNT